MKVHRLKVVLAAHAGRHARLAAECVPAGAQAAGPHNAVSARHGCRTSRLRRGVSCTAGCCCLATLVRLDYPDRLDRCGMRAWSCGQGRAGGGCSGRAAWPSALKAELAATRDSNGVTSWSLGAHFFLTQEHSHQLQHACRQVQDCSSRLAQRRACAPGQRHSLEPSGK